MRPGTDRLLPSTNHLESCFKYAHQAPVPVRRPSLRPQSRGPRLPRLARRSRAARATYPARRAYPHSNAPGPSRRSMGQPPRPRSVPGCGNRAFRGSALRLLARELLEQSAQLFGNGLGDDVLEHGPQLAPNVLLDRGGCVRRGLPPRSGRLRTPSAGLRALCLFIAPFALCANALHYMLPDISCFTTMPPVHDTIGTAG